ncbi:MAG: phosphoribosylanthranilate isomerase [Dehalococcoidia bacterium]|nr:phosphoribosylanthranilate isomerase [Dehalococcoidia bacterium]
MMASADGGNTTRVKICGVQRVEDAIEAARSGADFIGIAFVPGRRRTLEPSEARRIVSSLRDAAHRPPKVVGLTAGQPLADVRHIVVESGVDMVQLCGGEDLEYAEGVGVPVIKVVHVPLSEDRGETLDRIRREVQAFRDRGHTVTLDRKVGELQGGTGESFDWELAKALSDEGYSFFLAGGLTPENVGEAVRSVRPWGVDVSTGVETGGYKDAGKIRAFVAAARAAQEDFGGDGAPSLER